MKYYIPLHYDGGNRGCEAILKGTAIILGKNAEDIIAYSRDVDLDRKLGIDKFATLVPYQRESYLIDRLLAVINKLFHNNTILKWRLLYVFRYFLKQISPNDVMLSTGGDMMCYSNNEIIYTNDYMHRKGVITILWGCSMGPENLTPEKEKTLFNYSWIYARESLTFNFLQQIGLKNVFLCPDPAFVLNAEECELPECLTHNDVVGINLSSFVLKGINLSTPFGNEIINLINYILKNTSFNVLLIPHVTWQFGNENQDDYQIAISIANHYRDSVRVQALNISNMNYCNIRFAISKCRYFIGARTHSVISAYSMYVPTIALGYSIKSKGIAKDLGLPENLVIDCNHIQSSVLVDTFKYLMQNESSIHSHLKTVMPGYVERTKIISNHMSKLL